MDIDKLHLAAQRPPLYEKGDSVMWTDAHISRKLLELHLDPDVSSATRNRESLLRTLDFILSFCTEPPLSILDLGCGPGLYLEPLAEAGHRCTGIDFSENSIAYARRQAREKDLEITYIHGNYLQLDMDGPFDLIMLIYTDIGVLLPDERSALLERVHRALKPGGIFVFDVLNDKHLDEKFPESQSWSFEFNGFWNPDPYLELISGYHYPENRVYLKQHTILDEADRVRNYRFWTHYFAPREVMNMLSSKGFSHTEHFEDVLPSNDIWDGENISFYKTQRGKR